jgi:DNA-binding transcriptional LysR family regulator
MFDGRIISGITVFVAVAESGSYAGAADRVGLSRSGVGKAIARLEERTGMRLFDRTTRALKLTADGRAFLDEVSPLLQKLGEAAVPSSEQDIRGHIRVSCDAASGVYLLLPAIDRFLALHPRLRVDVVVRDRIDNLLKDGIDVAVRFGEPDWRDLNKRLLLHSRVVTCATAAYVERFGMPSSPDELLNRHRCVRLIDDVTGKPHVWHFENAAGEVREIVPDCTLTVNDAPSILAAIRTNAMVARALDFMIEEDLREGRIVELLPDWNHRRWPAYIYTPARTHAGAGVEAFIRFVSEQQFYQQ